MDATPEKTSASSGSPKEDGQPKRRACDECRSRKLACSKEADGCARCKREKVRCYYSTQKPMGRPRKRPHAEVQGSPHPPAQQAQQKPRQQQQRTQQQPPPITLQQHLLHEQQQQHCLQAPLIMPPYDQTGSFLPQDSTTIGMDLDMSFLDVGGNELNFLELLGPGFDSYPQPIAGLDMSCKDFTQDTHGPVWPMNGAMANINFDSMAMPPPVQTTQTEDVTLDQLAQYMSAPDVSGVPGMSDVPDVPSASDSSDLLEDPPSLTPNSPHSSNHHSTPSDTTSNEPAMCGCGASLYLAMDSIRVLPKEVGPAMKVARLAAKAAHDTISCKVCSDMPFESLHNPPLHCFQNMMMLGGLLPTISNAYTRILTLVDAEKERAEKAGTKIAFQLAEYGGIWGYLARSDNECNTCATFEGAVVEPNMWRLLVRALLRIDVYGVNDKTPGMVKATCEFTQPGLKDIIDRMEERSRTRHEHLDALIDSGKLPRPHGSLYVPLNAGGTDKPTCMRIIDIAKKSINDLVIP